VYRAIGEEMLWVASMPCGLPPDETIPIGRYGSSNVGRAKSVYRMGLGHRYGRRMQTISASTTTGRCRASRTKNTSD
jgi:glutamate--cysteine ligase